VLASFEHVMARPRWRDAFRGFESTYGFHHSDDYRGWLAAAGLVPTRVELIPKDMPHASRDAFTGWLRTAWHPYTSKVDEAHRSEFIDEIVDRHLVSHPEEPDGSVHAVGIRLQVHASKEGSYLARRKAGTTP
jgi:trans-aconitate 2-methyltransferase